MGARLRLPILAGMALASLQFLRFTDGGYAIDDAWISFRIARNAVEHGVLTFDTSQPPVEGMTNLLWTLLATTWVGLPWDPIGPARLIGAVLHLGAVAGAIRLAGVVAAARGGHGTMAATVTAVLLASTGSLAFHALSGLETALWEALLVGAISALVAGREAVGGALFGLLAATRPEGVLVGGLALTLARSWRGMGVFVAMVGALEAWRLETYGALVPNTFYAKPPDGVSGVRYIGETLLSLGVVGPLGAGPAVRRLPSGWAVGGVLAVLVAAVAWSGGDWMPGQRRLTEVVLALAVLTGVSAGLGARGPWATRAVWVAVGAWVCGSAAAAARGVDSRWSAHATMARVGALAAASPGVRVVALTDIGRFGWAFDGGIFDLVGLTDAHIARLPGTHGEKAWDEAYFAARSPDMVLVRCESEVTDPPTADLQVTNGERGVLVSVLDDPAWSYHGEVALTPGHWLLVFTHGDLRLDPARWGPRSRRELRDLFADPP